MLLIILLGISIYSTNFELFSAVSVWGGDCSLGQFGGGGDSSLGPTDFLLISVCWIRKVKALAVNREGLWCVFMECPWRHLRITNTITLLMGQWLRPDFITSWNFPLVRAKKRVGVVTIAQMVQMLAQLRHTLSLFDSADSFPWIRLAFWTTTLAFGLLYYRLTYTLMYSVL